MSNFKETETEARHAEVLQISLKFLAEWASESSVTDPVQEENHGVSWADSGPAEASMYPGHIPCAAQLLSQLLAYAKEEVLRTSTGFQESIARKENWTHGAREETGFTQSCNRGTSCSAHSFVGPAVHTA